MKNRNKSRFELPYVKLLCVSISCALLMGLSIPSTSAQTCASPAHVCDANTLITNLHATGNRNEYDDDSDEPSYIVWDAENAEAFTNCSSFVTHLLKHTYGWSNAYFTNWMGTSTPNAGQYHDAIAGENRFTPIEKRSDIQVGDFIAIKYPASSSTSGHILIVAGVPQVRTATSPLVTGMTQYEVSVIDSCNSYHGSSDTRYSAGEGIGRGAFRIYVDASDEIQGYTWSTFSNSTYYNQSQRHLVVGRLN